MSEVNNLPVGCQLCGKTSYISLEKYDSETKKGRTYYVCQECRNKIPKGRIIGAINRIEGLVDLYGNFLSRQQLRDMVRLH